MPRTTARSPAAPKFAEPGKAARKGDRAQEGTGGNFGKFPALAGHPFVLPPARL